MILGQRGHSQGGGGGIQGSERMAEAQELTDTVLQLALPTAEIVFDFVVYSFVGHTLY